MRVKAGDVLAIVALIVAVAALLVDQVGWI